MNDAPTDIARRMKRGARQDRIALRYWAGWRLQLTIGPVDGLFGPEADEFARQELVKLFGDEAPRDHEGFTELLAQMDRNKCHLSVSWRGGHPVEDGKRLLAELVVAFGVPEDQRAGFQTARVYVSNQPSPQVTHWVWTEQR
jgi:hypothetical protein